MEQTRTKIHFNIHHKISCVWACKQVHVKELLMEENAYNFASKLNPPGAKPPCDKMVKFTV